MKSYVLRNEYERYKKSVIEIDNVHDLVCIKLGLKCYIKELEGFAENKNKMIKRIESAGPSEFDEPIDELKEKYEIQLEEIDNIKKLLDSLDISNEITVKQLEIKYKMKE